MQVFVFEGIATSGKSTVIQQLKSRLRNLRVLVVEETETHIPIMKSADESHTDFFANLIEQKLISNSDLVIFDRLYLTQAYRSKNNINTYKETEKLLISYEPVTVFLKVDDGAIAERVHKASQHRPTEWKDYLKTKGRTIEQIAKYYAEQQASQLQLLKMSSIPYKIFDTTAHDYQEITEQLVVIATRAKQNRTY